MVAALDPQLVGALVELAGASIALVLTAVVVPWLRAKAESVQDGRRHAIYIAALDRLDAVIRPAVAATEQTVARHLRATEPDVGRLTSTQGAEALGAAVSKVISSFGEAEVDRLTQALGVDRAGLEGVIVTRIESAVHSMRARAIP